MSDVETQARELGWVDKDTFKGDPDKWVDAETFVKRGEELMPLLRAANKKLKERIDRTESKLTETNQLLAAANESIAALIETTSKSAIAEIKKTRVELVDQLKEARDGNDVEAELAIQGKIQEVDNALREADAPKKKAEPKAPDGEGSEGDFTQRPEWKEWIKDNEWFGKDTRKTRLAVMVAAELRQNGDTSMGREFFDKVSAEVNTTLGIDPDEQRRAPPKVEGESRSSGGSGSRGKSYADLPDEAKGICERQATRLVGKGRAFKDIESWRKHYTQKFFEE